MQLKLLNIGIKHLFIFVIGIIIIMIYFYCSHSNSLNNVNSIRILYEQSSAQSKVVIAFATSTLQFASLVVNHIKIAFQLTALLFLIQSLVNFWVLASIYGFLNMQMPQFLNRIVINVWNQYNQPLLSYIGFKINLPKLQNSSTQYGSAIQLDFLSFGFEPGIIFIVTVLQISIISLVINCLKKKSRQKQRNYLYHQAIEQKTKGFITNIINHEINQQINENQKFNLSNIHEMISSNQAHENAIEKQFQQVKGNIFDNQDYKIHNQQQQVKNQSSKIDSPASFMFPMVSTQNKNNLHQNTKQMYQMYLLINQELKNCGMSGVSTKHWSQKIHINKLDIISALISSYMPIILLPAYSFVFQPSYQNFKSKMNLMLYTVMVAIILIFPFLYVSIINIKKKIKIQSNRQNYKKLQKIKAQISQHKQIRNKSQNKDSILDNLQIQAFMLFLVNITIPIFVGIYVSVLPFFLVNTLVLVIHLVLPFKGHLTCDKINQIIHRGTFVLYHCLFFFLYGINNFQKVIKNNFPNFNLQTIEYYISFAIIVVFVIGGLHQLLEFIILFIFTLCKLSYLAINSLCSKIQHQDESQFQDQRNKIVPIENISQNNFKNQLPNIKNNVFSQKDQNHEIKQQEQIQKLKIKIMLSMIQKQNTQNYRKNKKSNKKQSNQIILKNINKK